MKTAAGKLGHLVKEIAIERGKITLFALVLPEDTFAWDLLVAAEWIDENNAEALQYLVKKIQWVLTKAELLNLSGIIILDNSEFIGGFSAIESEEGWEENDIDFLGQHVQKAYVFVAPVADIQIQMNR